MTTTDAGTPLGDVATSADAPANPIEREACAEPTRLVQLGTVHDLAHFEGDLLATQTQTFDPETLAPIGKVAPVADERAWSEGDDDEGPKHVVRDGHELELVTKDCRARVVDKTAKKEVVDTFCCAAGGTLDSYFSSTGRFLVCDASRSGLVLTDLTVPRPATEKALSFLPGTYVSPDDSYAVRIPVNAWSGPTPDMITYTSLATSKKTRVWSARMLEPSDGELHPDPDGFGVDFCGNGALFAVSGDLGVAVFRGSDATRLASAPARKGGSISFSASGRWISQSRAGATTIYRLE